MAEGALELVPFTGGLPFRRICLLKVRKKNGQPALGTGWFFGETLVITAGHVVDPAIDQSAVSVWPARHDSSDKPFGVWNSVQIRRSSIDDYAGIVLGEPVGSRVGTFGIAPIDAIAPAKRVVVTGYSADDGGQGQFIGEGNVSGVSSTTFGYDILTVGAQSGAPVWPGSDSDLVAGIHVREGEAILINDEVFAELMQWRNGL
jgi:V8-like Glu-specific endopeptidase